MAKRSPTSSSGPNSSTISTDAQSLDSDVDTVVVPAHQEGFERVFMGENRWYPIRLNNAIRPKIKYLAVYRVAPISAITHIAPVASIERWQGPGRFVVNFSAPPEALRRVPLLKGGRVVSFQGHRYTAKARIVTAKSLDDLWSGTDPALRGRFQEPD